MRCHLKVFLFFSSGDHFVQWSETILAILVEGHLRNISEKLFLNRSIGRRRCHLKVLSIFSSGGHLVQWSGTILAILVEGHPRNISVKLF